MFLYLEMEITITTDAFLRLSLGLIGSLLHPCISRTTRVHTRTLGFPWFL